MTTYELRRRSYCNEGGSKNSIFHPFHSLVEGFHLLIFMMSCVERFLVPPMSRRVSPSLTESRARPRAQEQISYESRTGVPDCPLASRVTVIVAAPALAEET